MPIRIELIKKLRERAGLTLAEAASRAGFANRQRWHRIETGQSENPGIQTLEAMAKVLRVHVRELIK